MVRLVKICKQVRFAIEPFTRLSSNTCGFESFAEQSAPRPLAEPDCIGQMRFHKLISDYIISADHETTQLS